MNGISLPKFLEGEPLPPGYFDPPDPYVDHPTRKIDLGALVRYVEETGKRSWDLTKEEVAQFTFD